MPCPARASSSWEPRALARPLSLTCSRIASARRTARPSRAKLWSTMLSLASSRCSGPWPHTWCKTMFYIKIIHQERLWGSQPDLSCPGATRNKMREWKLFWRSSAFLVWLILSSDRFSRKLFPAVNENAQLSASSSSLILHLFCSMSPHLDWTASKLCRLCNYSISRLGKERLSSVLFINHRLRLLEVSIDLYWWWMAILYTKVHARRVLITLLRWGWYAPFRQIQQTFTWEFSRWTTPSRRVTKRRYRRSFSTTRSTSIAIFLRRPSHLCCLRSISRISRRIRPLWVLNIRCLYQEIEQEQNAIQCMLESK